MKFIEFYKFLSIFIFNNISRSRYFKREIKNISSSEKYNFEQMSLHFSWNSWSVLVSPKKNNGFWGSWTRPEIPEPSNAWFWVSTISKSRSY